MIHQNDLQPITFITDATDKVIAFIKINDVITYKLSGFPVEEKLTYYYESILSRLKIMEDLPDFTTPLRLTKPNIKVSISARDHIRNNYLTCGCKFPSSGILGNIQIRKTLNAPNHVTYFVKEPCIAKLFGRVNEGTWIELDHITIIDEPNQILGLSEGGAFLFVNYHRYYDILNAQEFDEISFKFDKLPFKHYTVLDATYTDFPFYLTMRNQYGFFDNFRLSGNQEINLSFVHNSLENNDSVKHVFAETTKKIIVLTGLLEQKEKAAIAVNLQNLDLFQYLNGNHIRVLNDLKDINVLNTKEFQDFHKLQLSYSKITRRYQ
jgi:hypothetical protein